ncbi:MAG: hypothetical protein V1690_00270 [Candidatus Moraniibacteriota bacterium]
MSGRLIERLSSRLKRTAKTIAAQVKTYFIKYKKEVLGVTGLTLYLYYSWIIDDPVWWYIIYWFGYIYGNLIMSAFALPLNLFFLWYFTRKHGYDWVGIFFIDRLRKKINGSSVACLWEGMSNWWTKITLLFLVGFLMPLKFPVMMMAALLGKGDKAAFLGLSIFGDSFITTAYLRHGNYEPLQKRDYKIFLLSTLISCIYWSIRNSGVIALARVIWNYLFTT